MPKAPAAVPGPVGAKVRGRSLPEGRDSFSYHSGIILRITLLKGSSVILRVL